MTKFFDLCPGWVWAALLGLALVTCVALKLDLDHTKVALAEQKVATATQKSLYDKAALALSESNRKIETLRQKAMEEINDIVDEERGKTAAAVRAGDTVRSRLLDATKRYAASGGTPGDPAALARAEARTAALGQLLGTCDAVAADLGRDAELLATQVRGLQRAYRSLTATASLDPFPNGRQVYPGVGTLGHDEVDAALPVLTLDAGVDGDLRLFREQTLVRLQGNPAF